MLSQSRSALLLSILCWVLLPTAFARTLRAGQSVQQEAFARTLRAEQSVQQEEIYDCSFLHGVAAGDPLHDAIVLWTRSTPRSKSQQNIRVTWQVWASPQNPSEKSTPNLGVSPVAKGELLTDAMRDFTAKVDVTGLEPRVEYNYQFRCGATTSPIGSFHLPPPSDQKLESLTYAIFSCASWEWGRYTAYGAAAKLPLDFWVHVGDFIYEYGETCPQCPPKVRTGLDPPHEIVSLEDYRRRHAQYRTDADLQALTAAAPLIAIWDDHEIANNAWASGAENHQRDEGDYQNRKAAGMRAYHEWMPTRRNLLQSFGSSVMPEKSESVIWRHFSFGNLASMILLDTRHLAKTKLTTKSTFEKKLFDILESSGNPAPETWPGSDVELQMKALRKEVDSQRMAEDKKVIGTQQLEWLRQQVHGISKRKVPWMLVAQSLIMQDIGPPDYLEAIEFARRWNSSELVQKWEAAITALGAEMPTCNKMHICTSKQRILADLALGHYGINLNFDSWDGYQTELQTMLAALRVPPPTSAIVYGGDSHNAWAGMLWDKDRNAVAAEFDGMSVSSRGRESWSPYPTDLENAAWRASSPALLWANTDKRGFMLVHLNQTVQHIEYAAVDTSLNASYSTHCLAAFTVQHGKEGIRVAACPDGKLPLLLNPFLAPGSVQEREWTSKELLSSQMPMLSARSINSMKFNSTTH